MIPLKRLPTVIDEDVATVDCAPVAERDFAHDVRAELAAIGEMLIAKNKAYGNSALQPLRVFSSAAPTEQLRVRIDDKLSRLMRGSAAGEDVVLDLIGYLVILRLAEKRLAQDGGADA